MEVVRIILIVLEVLASIGLIVTVLLQSGKEAGLSGAIAGNTDTYLGKNKNGNLDQILASATKWVALAWLVLTLLLSIVA
jgi:preprotein translocase subunit SecG